MGKEHRPPSCLNNRDGRAEEFTNTKHLNNISDKEYIEEKWMYKKLKER